MRCIGHENVMNEAYIGCGFNISIHYENFGRSSHIICEKCRVKFTDGGIRVHKHMFLQAGGSSYSVV